MNRPSTQCLAGLICLSAAGIALYWGWAREFIAIDRCLDQGGGYEELWQTCERSSQEDPGGAYPGPTYSGVLDGKNVELKLRGDASAYRMVEDGLRVMGDLNTERGFASDPDATVYVLNPYAKAHQQIRLRVSKNAGTDELVQVGADEPDTAKAVLRAR